MDDVVMDVSMEYVGWKSTSVARRHVGVATSAAAVG